MKQKQNVEMIIPCNMERTQTVIEVYDLNHKSTYIYICCLLFATRSGSRDKESPRLEY